MAMGNDPDRDHEPIHTGQEDGQEVSMLDDDNLDEDRNDKR